MAMKPNKHILPLFQIFEDLIYHGRKGWIVTICNIGVLAERALHIASRKENNCSHFPGVVEEC